MNQICVLGDCLEVMKEYPDNSVDSIVTDPPYGLSFMGKKWDYDVPTVEIWKEALRVLKPGGHLLAFGGTRTYHRLVIAIEDAGFEIRDQIQWLYGSGFPKSHNIKEGKFKGFGTALKPANEPICLARKPLDGTVAQNLEKWGVGGLNIDESRIGTEEKLSQGASDLGYHGVNEPVKTQQHPQGRWPANLLLDESAAEMLDEQTGNLAPQGGPKKKDSVGKMYGGGTKDSTFFGDTGGASRFFYVAKASKRERNAGLEGMPEKESGIKNDSGRGFSEEDPYKKVLNQNHHPTVKPIKLMEYLIKLITPPGGVILDPFMGSGSTGVAAKNLGFSFIGIEMNQEYVNIAEKRIEAA